MPNRGEKCANFSPSCFYNKEADVGVHVLNAPVSFTVAGDPQG